MGRRSPWPSTVIRATGARIGSLLVNPGGPGISGVDWLPDIVSQMPADLLARFDVVGFDPPGVERTAPVTCVDDAGMAAYLHLDPDPPTAAGFAAVVAADRAFAAGCQARSGAELPYVSTVDAARDMDVLRQALGDAKLTYLGFSYGTLLGATYAGLFPTHVRAMVLDGDLDPALPVVDELDQQSAGLEAQLQQFISSCQTTPSCGWKPASLSALADLVTRVRANPLPAAHTARTVGPAEVLYGTAAALYTPSAWPALGQRLGASDQRQRLRPAATLRQLHRAVRQRHLQQPVRNQPGRELPGRSGAHARPDPGRRSRRRGGGAAVRGAKPL